MLILEKERNLALEKSLAKEKDKIEKLAMDLSLANDSKLRMSKDHALASDSLASLKNANSELQERHSRFEDIYKNLEVNYSTLWEKPSLIPKLLLTLMPPLAKGALNVIIMI